MEWNSQRGSRNAPVQNAELIKSLTDCGIVNTISSKNDEQNARHQALEQLGIWDFFVSTILIGITRVNR